MKKLNKMQLSQKKHTVIVDGYICSFTQLQKIYDCYLRNIISICKKAEFAEFPLFGQLIHYYLTSFKWRTNSYLSEPNYIELGLSVYKYGSHWILRTNGKIWEEGGHRIEGLQRAAYIGLIPKSHKLLAFNQDTVIDIELEYFEAEELKDIKAIGYKTKKKKCRNFDDALPLLWRVLYKLVPAFGEYKKKYGEEFPPSPICNDIVALRNAIRNS